MILVLQKLGKTFTSNVFNSQGKIIVQNATKPKKVCSLQVGDSIDGLSVVSVDNSISSEEKNVYVTDMQNLKNELNEIFGNNWWDFTNKKALKVLKKYNIIRVEKMFSGTRLTTRLGISQYFAGEPCKQEYLEIEVKEIDWSTVQKIAALTK